MPRDRYFARHVPSDAKLQRWNPYFEKYTKGNKAWYYFTGTHANLKEWKEDIRGGLGHTVPNWRAAKRWVWQDSQRYSNHHERPFFGFSRGGGLAEALGGIGYGAWNVRGIGRTAATKGAVDKASGDFLHDFGVRPLSKLLGGLHPKTAMAKYRGMQRIGGVKRPRHGYEHSSATTRDYAPAVPVRLTASGTATSVGRFRRPSKRAKPSAYLNKGYKEENESHGTHTQTNVNYIGHTSATLDTVAYDVGIALIRYIMRRHYQYDYTAVHNRLWSDSSRNSRVPQLVRFTSRRVQPDGNDFFDTVDVQIFDDDTTVAKTLNDWAIQFRDDVFKNPLFRIDPDKAHHGLYGYQILEARAADSIETSFSPIVHLQDMYIKVYSSVNFKVQNITVADTANDSTDHKNMLHIEQNPVKGMVYQFTDMQPVLKRSNRIEDGPNTLPSKERDHRISLFALPKENGILMPSSDNAGFSIPGRAPDSVGSFLNPPDPQMFKNLSRYCRVTLAPGGIKYHSIKFNFDGRLQALMDGMNRDTSTGMYGGLGTSFMFALEKSLRTGDSDNVVINYHINHHHGAMVKKITKKPFTKLINIRPETTGLA